MQRHVPLLLCLALCVGCLALVGCGAPAQPPAESTTQPPAATQAPTPTANNQETTTAPKTLPVYTPGLIELNPGEDYCDENEFYFKRHYRVIYYRIPSPIDNLAGEEGYAFLAELSAQADVHEDLPEMLLVTFVKRFDIKKEVFENAVKAIESNYQNGGYDTQNEEFEIPNADIIYTFDNEIINAYYSRQ
jgi:hypothetical protein